MGAYREATRQFIAKQSGPAGDTKYDIFDKSGMTRGQMRRARQGKAAKRPVAPQRLKAASTGFVPGETV